MSSLARLRRSILEGLSANDSIKRSLYRAWLNLCPVSRITCQTCCGIEHCATFLANPLPHLAYT